MFAVWSEISPVWRWHIQLWAEQRWTGFWRSGRSASAPGHAGCSPAEPLFSGREDAKDGQKWEKDIVSDSKALRLQDII